MAFLNSQVSTSFLREHSERHLERLTLSIRPTPNAYDKSSHPELCSEVADGVTHTIVSLFREPDAGNPPVRFDEREQETEPCQTGLRRALRKQRVCMPPGDYRYCAGSRLHSKPPNRVDHIGVGQAGRPRQQSFETCFSILPNVVKPLF